MTFEKCAVCIATGQRTTCKGTGNGGQCFNCAWNLWAMPAMPGNGAPGRCFDEIRLWDNCVCGSPCGFGGAFSRTVGGSRLVPDQCRRNFPVERRLRHRDAWLDLSIPREVLIGSRDLSEILRPGERLWSFPSFTRGPRVSGPGRRELRELLAIAADPRGRSRAMAKTRPSVFESRMEIVESDAVSPLLRERIRDLDNRWSRTILEHVQRLKSALGPTRFQTVDEFARSVKPMFDMMARPAVKILNGLPAK